jgi:ParB/RepB/Spo0J family partition protein
MGLAMINTADIVVPEHRHKRKSRERYEATKASIADRGIKVPLIVADTRDGKFELVAGEGRLNIAQELEILEVPALIEEQDAKANVATAALENMAREPFSPAEEAEIIRMMLDEKYTTSEIARITGMTLQLVKARLVLAEVPEEIRDAYGHGGLPPSSAPTIKAIHDANPALAQAVVKIAEKDVNLIASNLDPAVRLLKQLPWLFQRAKLRGKAPFVCDVRRRSYEPGIPWVKDSPESIKLSGEDGAWFIERWDKANRIRPKLDITDADIDQAIAYGAAFGEKGEFGSVVIHDRDWLTSHVNTVVLPRMRKAAEAADQGKQAATKAAQGGKGDLTKVSPRALASRLAARFRRELKPRAQAANIDLGTALLNKLSKVELTRDVAVLFAHELLGPNNVGERWAHSGRSRQFAEAAARALPQMMKVETTELKNGRTREDTVYLAGADAEAWMWGFIEAAKSPEEVLGRTLVILAAAGSFRRECGADGKTPSCQTLHNTKAQEALQRVIRRAIPASIKAIETEVDEFDADKAAAAAIAQAKREQKKTAKPAAKKDSGTAKPSAARSTTSAPGKPRRGASSRRSAAKSNSGELARAA